MGFPWGPAAELTTGELSVFSDCALALGVTGLLYSSCVILDKSPTSLSFTSPGGKMGPFIHPANFYGVPALGQALC